MKQKRLLTVGVTLFAAASMLAACGGNTADQSSSSDSGSGSSTVELTLRGTYGAGSNSAKKDALEKEIIPAFEKANPGITIKYVDMPYDGLKQKLTTGAAAGELPDLVRTDLGWNAQFAKLGVLKQLDGVGPSGETIMDYSIFDAIRAGFGKVVFVIRRTFEQEFREKIISKYEHKIPVEVVFQDLDKLPEGFTVPEGREKPWGTNHAVMMAAEVINEPFAVINADDFYGRHGFAALADKLRSFSDSHDKYCMVGYRVGNTLSESGTVARGVCEVDDKGFLTGVVERTSIARRPDGKIAFTDENGQEQLLEENTPVSMNMWGFTPDYFQHSEKLFCHFLNEQKANPKFEYYIPLVVNHLVAEGTSTVEVLDTPDSWFGVTYAEDRPDVVAKLAALASTGAYPEKLF